MGEIFVTIVVGNCCCDFEFMKTHDIHDDVTLPESESFWMAMEYVREHVQFNFINRIKRYFQHFWKLYNSELEVRN